MRLGSGIRGEFTGWTADEVALYQDPRRSATPYLDLDARGRAYDLDVHDEVAGVPPATRPWEMDPDDWPVREGLFLVRRRQGC